MSRDSMPELRSLHFRRLLTWYMCQAGQWFLGITFYNSITQGSSFFRADRGKCSPKISFPKNTDCVMQNMCNSLPSITSKSLNFTTQI